MQSLQEDQRSLIHAHIPLEHQLRHLVKFPVPVLQQYSNPLSYKRRQFPYLLYHHGSIPQSISHLVPPGQPASLLESSKSDSAFALDQPFSPPWTTGDTAVQSAWTPAILPHAGE